MAPYSARWMPYALLGVSERRGRVRSRICEQPAGRNWQIPHRRAKRVRTDDRQAARTDIEAPSHRQA